MSDSTRKLIGSLAILVLVILYSVLATTIAAVHLMQSPWWVHLLYFFFTGLLWVLPAMWIIRWMLTPREKG